MKLIEKEKNFIPFWSIEIYEYTEMEETINIVWNLKTALKFEKPRYVYIGLQKGQKNTIKMTRVFHYCG